MSLTVAELEAVVSFDQRPLESGLSGMLGKLGTFGKGAGKILGGVGVAAGGLFAAGVASAMNLEDVRARMRAELGLTAEEAERLGKVAGDVYANNFGSSLEEVSAAIGTVVSSIGGMRNATDAEVQAMTERALTFADVFQVDVARATQSAGQLLKNGLARDAEQAFDLLTATMQRVPVQVREDVLDASDEYGQFFAALGIGGEQGFTMLADAAGKGMYGIDKTGDALKEFTVLSTDMSESSKAAYDALGLSQDKMASDLLAGGDKAAGAFDTIVDAMAGMDSQTEQSQVALKLFGVPLEDLGTKDMGKFIRALDRGKKGLGDFEGATDRMSEAIGSTASAKLSSFWRTIKQETIGALGGTVLPWVQKFAGDMTTTLTPMVKKVGPIIRDVGDDVASFAEDMSKKAGPIIDQVVGVLGDLFREGGKGRQVFGDLAEDVSATWLTVMDTVGPVIDAIHSFFNSDVGGVLVDGIVRVVGSVTTVIGGLLTIVKGIAQVISGVFTGDWSKAWEGIKNIVSGVVKVIGGILSGLWNTLRTGASAGFTVVKKIVSAGFNALVVLAYRGITSVVGYVRGLPAKAAGALSALGGKLSGMFNSAWVSARSTVIRGVEGVVGIVRGIPAKLLAAGSGMFRAGKSLITRFLDGLRALGGIATSVAANIMNAIVAPINAAIGAINEAIPNKIGAGRFSFNLPNNPFPTIPGFATGAHVTGPTYAMIGEGREAESVLPDSVLRGLLEDVHASGRNSAREKDTDRRSLMRDAIFQVRDDATARELIGELTHALRVADFGGVFA